MEKLIKCHSCKIENDVTDLEQPYYICFKCGIKHTNKFYKIPVIQDWSKIPNVREYNKVYDRRKRRSC